MASPRDTSGNPPGPELRPRLQVLAAAALFSTGGTAIKATTFDAWQVGSLRSGIAALALALLLPRALRTIRWQSLAVGLAYAATMLLYVAANKLTTAAAAIFLQSTAPLYVLALGPLLLGEPIRRRDPLWMLLIAGGLAALFADRESVFATAPDPFAGNLLGAVAGLTWALAILGLRWLGRDRGGEDPRALGAVIAGNGLACLLALPLALPLSGAGAADWGVVTYLGLFQIGAAYLLLVAGISRVPAFETSLLLLAEPVLSPLWAWLVHGEMPGPWSVLGGALILTATVGRSWAASRRP